MVDSSTLTEAFVQASKDAPIQSVFTLVQSWFGYFTVVFEFGLPVMVYLGVVTMIINHFFIGHYIPGQFSYAVSFAVAVFSVPILAPFLLPIIAGYVGGL